ncbi:alpha/beta hydrolase family protein [Rhodohalobacter halophilus]|uniref:alpha/beta hydrolase family protein n=1 Tax=Rhodohalobacter halophilus TaxID=1812810 RepID=UPI00083FBE93|nr:alpha/beta fold hydrolase [Rhodohalobacter halophilus]
MKSNSVNKESGVIRSNEDLPIYYDLYSPSAAPSTVVPVVLFLHGFKGFKDWGAFPDACEELARAGFAVVAFNFSLNGIGKNMTEFDQLELFERETLSQDLDDVGKVIEAIKQKEIASDRVLLDSDRIGIIGHSRGGHTAVAAAAEYSEIMSLITWSAVADYNARWSEQMKQDWEEKGFTEILNSRTHQTMKIGKVVYDDALANADRLMAIQRVRELHIPSLFLAGKEDEAVPYSDSEKLYRACPADEKEVRIIEGAGHTFNVSHPFEEEKFPPVFEEVLDHTEGWLIETLK